MVQKQTGNKGNYPKANRQILSNNVRLVDSDGTMLGVLSINEAIAIAEKKGLDVVEVSPNAEPPVCKIMDFGKFKYEQKKKAQESKKKQKTVSLKEIKLRPNIGENDLLVKLKSIEKFISAGDKVKITLKFRGREITHQEVGMNVLNRIINDTKEIAKPDVLPKLEGKQIIMLIAPIK